MADQAEALRQLAMQMTASPGTASGCTVLVMGAERAVGTTTISGSLALALQRQGRATTLVDADFDHPGLVPSWGIAARYTLADLIARRRTVREVLQPGPCGLQLVAGASHQEAARQREAAGADLAAALQSLERQRWVVVDAGAGEVEQAVDRAVQVVVLVTTPDSRALRQAYQRIKTLGSHHTAARLWCVMNQVRDPAAARRAQTRLTLVCDRFLNLELCAGAVLPADTELAATTRARPARRPMPPSAFSSRIERFAEQLTAETGRARRVAADVVSAAEADGKFDSFDRSAIADTQTQPLRAQCS